MTVQPRSRIQINHLVGETRRSGNGTQILPMIRLVPRLFRQLPHRTDIPVFPRIDLPGGQFIHDRPHGIPELFHEDDAAVGQDRYHSDGPLVIRHLPGGGASVRQAHRVYMHMEQPPLEGRLAADKDLVQGGVTELF